MLTTSLLASAIFVACVIAWLLRQRFVKQLPSREALTNFCIVALVALLLCIVSLVVLLLYVGLLPDILTLISTVNLMPPLAKTVLGLAAAVAIIFAGCSKRTETPKQPATHWSAPDTGYHAETPPNIPKEGK